MHPERPGYSATTPNGNKSAVTSADGFYSLNLVSGQHVIQVQFTGMKRTKRNLILFSNGQLNIDMEKKILATESSNLLKYFIFAPKIELTPSRIELTI